MTPRSPLPTLVGQRCTLRELVPADAPSLQRNADDVEVWRNLFEGFPHPYTMADAIAWCDGGAHDSAYGHVWGIDVRGEVIGCVNVAPQQGPLRCNAEVGYWIGQPHWRHGIATEALGLVTAWVWQELPDITRLFAPIFAWNTGSQAVAGKCGYVKEADMPRSAIKDGRVIDRVQFAIYRP
ncbi:GNAT family N-acetyltransferase [Aquincola tertiaricarbonis]|uniref:GNAT family N-acetyltransferase n=1 Tax=Aquincola tertiaricarbonis TaxID=391953 RepID=UPI000696933C|nr:GNAT family N-acetyltransferase [Aquincola tertiaricarbonis]